MPDVYDDAYDGAEQDDNAATQPAEGGGAQEEQSKPNPGDVQLVQRILARIRRDKRHFKKSFERMERSMFMTRHGRDKAWSEDNYVANVTGQHIKVKTANLYAKNPKIISTRKEKLDFLVWDESVQTLQMAIQTFAAGQAVIQAQMQAQMQPSPGAEGPQMGHNGGPVLDPAQPAMPAMPAGYDQAAAILQDFQQGMARRQMLKKFGKTLELVFADAMNAQTPLDFKAAMKRHVRRTLTTGVGYVEVGFQRDYGIPAEVSAQLEDYRQRLAHLETMLAEAAEGEEAESEEYKADMAELQASMNALNEQDQVVIRSGVTFDFIPSRRVIPDMLCTSLVGFVGAKHLTIEYTCYTKADIKDMFGVDLGNKYTPYTLDGQRQDGSRGVNQDDDCTEGAFGAMGEDHDIVCLYKHYDKRTGLVYHLVEGYGDHLKPPAAPNVTVSHFWPVYALTFNETESDSEPYPISDAERMAPQQREINRSRQGKREHRDAARPRWVYPIGALDEEDDVPQLRTAKPFDVIGLKGVGSDLDVKKLLQPIPVPGVDPNLYDTNEVLQDASLTVGAQAAQLGGVAPSSTATGSAIANQTTSATDSSSIDDLDEHLTMIARDAGQIAMTNLTKEEVVRIAGPGAVWVEDLGMSVEDIYDEVFLKVEAGSTGKPNQAEEIRNFKDLGPLLLQIGSIPPEQLAREALRRLDDRLDLTEMVVSGVPAIVAANRMAQPAQGDPQRDPAQQGGEGGDKNATPSGPSGSSAPMGNNQTPKL